MVVDQNWLSWLYPFLEHLNEDEIRVLRTMGSDWYTVHGLVGVGFSEDKAKKIIDRLVQVGAVGLRRGYRCD